MLTRLTRHTLATATWQQTVIDEATVVGLPDQHPNTEQYFAMASETHIRHTLDAGSRSTLLQVIIAAVILALAYYLLTGDRPYAGIPVVKPQCKGLVAWLPAKYAFMLDSRALFQRGRKEHSGCFQIAAAGGYKVIIPTRFVEEVKSHPDLSFTEANAHDFFVKYPGFEGFDSDRAHELLMDMIKWKLTPSSDLITQGLIEETNDSYHVNMGEPVEWQTIPLRQQVCDTVARLSARIFLGQRFSRNPEWVQISKEYAINGFVSRTILHLFPKPLQPAASWVLPTTRKLRNSSRRVRQMIEPEVQRRQQDIQEAEQAGRKPEFDDSICWLLEVCTLHYQKVSNLSD